ncbi:unnamed protein product [Calypogeia fissa]
MVETTEMAEEEWYDISCDEVCEHIARLLNTTMYSSKIKANGISGECFFFMADAEFATFFQLMGVASLPHRVKLKRWCSECKERQSLITGPLKLPPKKPSSDNTISTATHRQSPQECLMSEEQGKTHDPVNKETSREDSESVGVIERFYPTPEEIFNLNCKTQGRNLLAFHHQEAYKAHMANFRIVRSWFAQYLTNEEQHEYLRADFTANPEIKERCRRYVRSRMEELVPLKFVCRETGAEHEIPWPEEFVFDAVKNRKHEWKKTNPKRKEGKEEVPLTPKRK